MKEELAFQPSHEITHAHHGSPPPPPPPPHAPPTATGYHGHGMAEHYQYCDNLTFPSLGHYGGCHHKLRHNTFGDFWPLSTFNSDLCFYVHATSLTSSPFPHDNIIYDIDTPNYEFLSTDPQHVKNEYSGGPYDFQKPQPPPPPPPAPRPYPKPKPAPYREVYQYIAKSPLSSLSYFKYSG